MQRTIRVEKSNMEMRFSCKILHENKSSKDDETKWKIDHNII